MPIFQSIYEADLPPRAVLVLMNLKDRANRKDGSSFPSIRTICRDTGLSRSTVKRAISDLEHSGLLTKEARWRPNGSTTSNTYRLV